jgi:hypothetical protein
VGATVSLDGSGSSDGEGDPLSYQWSLAAAPGGSTAELEGATTSSPRLVADLAGVYEVELVVNDGQVSSGVDSVRITASEGGFDLLSDTFDRPDSPVVGAGWVELEATGARVSIAGNRLFFDESSDIVRRAQVSRGFAPAGSGTLRWEFDFDWARTGREGTYGVHMQLGENGLMSESEEDDGIGVNLIWTSIDGAHQSLGYSVGGMLTPLAVVSGLAGVSVEVDLEDRTYSVAVDGEVAQSGIPFDADVALDTVRFLTDNLNEQNFSGRAFDNVVIRR